MIDKLGGITTDIVRLALDASWTRHKVIANNIANSKTSNFSPQRVKFESEFSRALLESRSLHGTQSMFSELKDLKPIVYQSDQSIGLDDKSVFLDQEMVNMAKNTTHYKALIKALGKEISIISLAIKGGQ